MKAKHTTRHYQVTGANVGENGKITSYSAKPAQSLDEWIEQEIIEFAKMAWWLFVFLAGSFFVLWFISTQARSN